MPIALETTRRQSHDDDWTFEKRRVLKAIVTLWWYALAALLFFTFRDGFDAVGEGRRGGRAVAKDTNPVDSLESSDLFCSVQAIHHGQLDIHEDQVEATLSPFVDRLSAVHGCMPPYFQTLHESFEEFEVDDVVFDDENIDWRDRSVQKTGGEIGRRIESFLGLLVRFTWTWRGDRRRSCSVVSVGLALGRKLRAREWWCGRCVGRVRHEVLCRLVLAESWWIGWVMLTYRGW